jgi:hypothetical protein
MADVAAEAAELAAFLRGWAQNELAGYCPLYERVALALADDPPMLARLAGVAAREKIVAVLLFAAVKSLVDAEPALPLARIYASGAGDPWPAFRALLDERFDEVAELLRTRRIQTNEVNRAAAVLPALTVVQARLGRPLALVEIGPSAGLNLLLDRFAYDYGDGRMRGDPSSRVRLRCEPRGPLRPPLPAVAPPIASRCGIDLAPVDVTDDAQCRWLEACVWPGAPERAERLRAALALARADPPRILTGDALDLLPPVLGAIDDASVPCIVSTWVLAYLSEEQRHALAAIVDAAGRERDLACVTAEFPNVSPFAGKPPRPATGDKASLGTLLGATVWKNGERDARALAWMQAHGTWIDWLDAEWAR